MTDRDETPRADRDMADAQLIGWRLALLITALAVGNVIALSNVPGYTALVPYAAGSLQGVNPSFGTWGTTHHMMGIVLGLPIARALAARYGEYRVYVAAFIAYAAASFLCATSETIWFFVPMRFLLGLVGGVIIPLGQGLSLAEFPEHRRSYGAALWGVVSMAPFTQGVFMGGFWAEYFNWRMLFYSNIFIGLPIAGIVGALLYGRDTPRRFASFDSVGFILLGAIVLSLQTILNQGNDFDWLPSSSGSSANAGRRSTFASSVIATTPSASSARSPAFSSSRGRSPSSSDNCRPCSATPPRLPASSISPWRSSPRPSFRSCIS